MGRLPLLAAVVAVALTPGCLSGFGASTSGGEPLEFGLVTTDGRNVTAADYRGEVLVLDLMATWCAPCRAEMPHLREFHEAHPEVALLSVDVDPSEKTEANDPLPRFRSEFNASWEFAYDATPTRESVFFKTGARIIPTIVVVDAEGVVRERITEYPLSADELWARVSPHVAGGDA